MAGGRGFTRMGAAISELDTAARDRLEDAEQLLRSARHAAAIMMGLYALEIRLKERICRHLDLDHLPRAFETHDLAGLLVLVGLTKKINEPDHAHVLDNWNELVIWSKRLNDLRYGPESHPDWPREKAASFFSQLRDPPNGILPWLMTRT